MSWADLGAEILEEFASVSVTEQQRGAWDRWRARRLERERICRRELRERHTWQIRQLRAAERRRVARTEWAAMAAAERVAVVLKAPAMTGTGGRKPHRHSMQEMGR